VSITLALAMIVIAAVAAQLLAARASIPAVVPLLIAGVLLGPDGLDAFDPDELFGDLLDPFVALAVGAILFDGALTLRRESLEHGLGGVVTRLCTIGVVITWAGAAAGAGIMLGLDHRIAILLGAILTLSGPTVVIPILDYVRPTPRLDAALRWEGILVDPIGAILAVITYHLITSGEGEVHIFEFLGTLGIGVAVGFLGAVALAFLLSERRFASHLEATAILAVVLLSVALASEIRDDAGLVTAIAMGLVLAHRQRELIQRAPEFGETLVSLLLGVLFVILAARVDPDAIVDLGWGAVAFVALLIVVLRPLSAGISTWRSVLDTRERALVAWMMPRGIVAASTASTFGFGLAQAGVPDANKLVPATFLVIAVTVAVYGLSGRPLALRLGVAERGPRPRGSID
jgi:NhaP-type Na+/H+ or K+/H+ antiporter